MLYEKFSRCVEMDDLKQEAILGLIEACNKMGPQRDALTTARITTVITGRIKKFLGQMFKDDNMVVVIENEGASEKVMSYQQFQKIKKRLPSNSTHTVQRRVVQINEGSEDWDDSVSRKPAKHILVA